MHGVSDLCVSSILSNCVWQGIRSIPYFDSKCIVNSPPIGVLATRDINRMFVVLIGLVWFSIFNDCHWSHFMQVESENIEDGNARNSYNSRK